MVLPRISPDYTPTIRSSFGVTPSVVCQVSYQLVFPQLVGGFQAEAAEKARETEATKLKLVELRKLISQLLRSINDVSILFLLFLTPHDWTEMGFDVIQIISFQLAMMK